MSDSDVRCPSLGYSRNEDILLVNILVVDKVDTEVWVRFNTANERAVLLTQSHFCGG